MALPVGMTWTFRKVETPIVETRIEWRGRFRIIREFVMECGHVRKYAKMAKLKWRGEMAHCYECPRSGPKSPKGAGEV